MATRRDAVVVDADGTSGRLCDVIVHDNTHATAVVELKDGARVRLPFEHLEHHDNGGYSIAARWRELASGTEHSLSIPVIAERVVVGVRPAPEQRVRVRRKVIEERKTVETPMWKERIEVERRPMDVYVDAVPGAWRDGDVLVVPRVEEVVVVEKRLRVVEEVRIRTVRERHIDKRAVVLRRHEIEVEGADTSEHTNSPTTKD